MPSRCPDGIIHKNERCSKSAPLTYRSTILVLTTANRAAGKPSIAGSSESKAIFLRDRHNIIKQIVLRNENFSPPAFAGRDRTNYLKVSNNQATHTHELILASSSHQLEIYLAVLVNDSCYLVCLVDPRRADYVWKTWMAPFPWTYRLLLVN